MSLLSVSDAHLAFGHVALLDAAEFSIEAGERIALIGRNGTGKSSLLKAIIGEIPLDQGDVVRRSGLTQAYVPQEPAFEPGHSVFEAVAGGLAQHAASLSQWRCVVERLETEPDNAALFEQMTQLQVELEASGAWDLTHRIDRMLSKLSLDPKAQVAQLSGGLRKRVAIARALVLEPELLLLDEPTNHLDIESIQWLEQLLIERRAATLFITHDRQLMDTVASRIVELDRGRLRSYPGDFSAYQTRKADELAQEAQVNAKFDRLLAQEEVWIRKGVEARRTRNEGRVRRLEALRQARAERRERMGRTRLEVDTGERSGRLVAEIEGVGKRWQEGPWLVRGLDAVIQRGDRIGLIGPNGAGKTTLLRLILGELKPEEGRVRTGTGLQVAYFDQLRAQLDEEASVVETISPGSEWIEIGGVRTHVMSYLGRFLFAPERARSPVKSLSGGERNRLLLARLFARPANLLVLDEPTNDLDIDTLELLEELLTEYSGTIMLVSHDRAFLDAVVTQSLAFEGEAHWVEYAGGYSDVVAARARRSSDLAATAQATAGDGARPGKGKAGGGRSGAGAPSSAKALSATGERSTELETPLNAELNAGSVTPRGNPAKSKLSYKEQRELAELPGRIETLEAEQKLLSERLADPATYGQAGAATHSLHSRFAEIEEELMVCLERWSELESRVRP
jgi:ATP-binding cassette subfamily F protein uup